MKPSWPFVFLYLLRMCCFTYTNMPHCLGHYSRYLSILDVDQKTLRCPAYSGTLLSPLVEPRSHFKRGKHLLHVCSKCGKSKLVATALLLTFSQGCHTPRRPRKSTGTQCFHSEIHRDDKKILTIYLNSSNCTSWGSTNCLRFSYTTNSIFKLWKCHSHKLANDSCCFAFIAFKWKFACAQQIKVI